MNLPRVPPWAFRVLGTAALLALVAYAGQAWWRGPVLEWVPTTRRDLVQTVVGSARVESPNRVDIASQITATVAHVPVAEGTQVQAGAVLIELAGADLEAAARQAERAVAQARGRLRQIRELQSPLAEQAWRQAKAQMDNAAADLRRSQALLQQGFIGQAALEDVAKVLELAQAQAASARIQWDSTRAAGSEYALAEGAVQEAQAAADVARARAGFTHIRAPRDGVLISRNVEVGDVAQPGKALMTLSPLGAMQLVLEVDEKNLRLVRLGQKALASADAYAQQNFAATVAYINPGVNAQTGAVQVKLSVDQPVAYLRQDMTVSVDLEVARRPQALLLPLVAVRGSEGNTPWVLRYADGRAQRAVLGLGARSAGMVEVLSGVGEGDRVLLAPTGITDGQRVRLGAAAP